MSTTTMESSNITVLPPGLPVHPMRFISEPVFQTPIEKYIIIMLQNKAIDALDQNRYEYTKILPSNEIEQNGTPITSCRLMHMTKFSNINDLDTIVSQCDYAVGSYYWKRYNLATHENNNGSVIMCNPAVTIYNNNNTIYVQTIVDICQ